ncbi:MAG: hypothetical protein QXZ30_00565 [Candidatus Bilamarchaeaceae archaeon]
MKIKLLFLIGLLLVDVLFAGCAYDGYSTACKACKFSDNGKIDQACMKDLKERSLICISGKYPIMSAKYSLGQCPGVDACTSQLSACISKSSTGNDEKDCKSGVVADCYYEADECIHKVALECGDQPASSSCALPVILMTVVLCLGLYFGITR